MRLLNLTATAVLGGSILLGCGTGSSTDPAAGDVSVTVCAADPAGGKPRAEGNVVNKSSKPSGYTFRVRFLDPSGNEVSQASSAVGRVEPGASAVWRQEGAESAKGPLTCRIGNVTRNAVG